MKMTYIKYCKMGEKMVRNINLPHFIYIYTVNLLVFSYLIAVDQIHSVRWRHFGWSRLVYARSLDPLPSIFARSIDAFSKISKIDQESIVQDVKSILTDVLEAFNNFNSAVVSISVTSFSYRRPTYIIVLSTGSWDL